MAATKNPTLCYLAAPTWEDPKRTIKIRQSDLDEARAERAASAGRLNDAISGSMHDALDRLDAYIGRMEEAINAQEQLDRYNYEDPCVARHA